jgi:hypothetical protein
MKDGGWLGTAGDFYAKAGARKPGLGTTPVTVINTNTKSLNISPAGSLPAFYATLVHLLRRYSALPFSGVCCLPTDIMERLNRQSPSPVHAIPVLMYSVLFIRLIFS